MLSSSSSSACTAPSSREGSPLLNPAEAKPLSLPSSARKALKYAENPYMTTMYTKKTPKAGKKRKVDVEDADDSSVVVVTPRVRTGPDQAILTSGDAPSIQWEVTEVSGTTYVPVSGYSNYITDPEYIELRKSVLLGKIDEWRNASLQLLGLVELKDAQREGGALYDTPGCYFKQRRWAEHVIPAIMTGIRDFTKVPVEIMNQESLFHLVPGISSIEAADFVYHISKCRKFEIIVTPMPDCNDFRIETEFDRSTTRAYGKNTKLVVLELFK
jgi:hypothetical protein